MNIDDYQRAAVKTAVYPGGITYPALGLAGEAGEVAEHAKKAIRDDAGAVTAERFPKMVKELGDVLWYLANLAHELGVDLSTVAHLNISKLRSRQERGTLQGSGDDR